MSFKIFNFNPQIEAGILDAGYDRPTPIQSQAIPPVLAGRDLLGLAQTGTGKTAAFVLPILQRLSQGQRGKPRALIVAPTRELAEQTHQAIKVLGRKSGLRSLTLYGGVSPQPQIRSLRAGVDIIVACPGRLLDLYDQKLLSLNKIEMVVLDEADQMFDMGFLPAIRRIMKAVPAGRQTLLFSATMPNEIRALASEFLNDPALVEIGSQKPVETVSHAIFPVNHEQKLDLLLSLVRGAGEGQILVFTRTKHRATRLADQLRKKGLSATALQGNLSQNRRQEAMDGFRSGRYRLMVATDIAARGIDVSQVSHVINFDMPDTAEAYTHRIGRTGRMERLGAAYSLVTTEDAAMVHTIEKFMKSHLERRTEPGFEVDTAFLNQSNPPKRVQNQRPARPANLPKPGLKSQRSQPAGSAVRRSA